MTPVFTQDGVLSIVDPLKWQKLPSFNLPPRSEHSTFVSGGVVHVFGGAQEAGPRSDVWNSSSKSNIT